MKIQSKLRLKQGEKRLGEDISGTNQGLKLKYKIFEGYDWYKGKYIYQVVGINNDFVGEWHTSKKGANDELKSLNKNKITGVKKYHKDTKSHNVNIKVVSGVKAKSLIGEVSNIKKIDVLSFTKAEMTAKLFSISRNWAMLPEKIALNKPRATVWVRNTIRENFIYPKRYEKQTTLNLLLFLLGNENNLFSKAIK